MAYSLGADSADRVHARLLHRALKPPRNRKGRPAQAAPSENQINGKGEYKTAEAAAQRELEYATRRAAQLDRTADLLLSVGQHHAAERLSALAHELREVAR